MPADAAPLVPAALTTPRLQYGSKAFHRFAIASEHPMRTDQAAISCYGCAAPSRPARPLARRPRAASEPADNLARRRLAFPVHPTAWTIGGILLLLNSCASGRMVNQCALPGPDSRPRAAETRSLAILSYNVKGLPGLAGGGDNDARYRAISNTFRAYDVVGVQELFSRRSYLVSHLPEGYVASYRSSRRSLLSMRVYGNGLSIIGPSHRLLRDLRQQHTYTVCAGWLTGATDCPSRKGVLYTPVALENGDTVHVFNLHMDAGSRRQDARARAQQLDETRSVVERMAGTAPVIVLGDFNIDRADSSEVAVLEAFRTALRLSDTGTLTAASCRERLDYIFYRGGDRTTFRLLSTGIDALAMGSPPLSDHPPIYALLAY